MKKLLFVISALNAGGAEKSLVNLLATLDYSQYNVDLLLFKKEGAFIKQIPASVNILDTPKELSYLYRKPDLGIIKYPTCFFAGLRRLIGTGFSRIFYKHNFRAAAQIRWTYFYRVGLLKLSGYYDIAISYNNGEPAYYVAEKVNAGRKICWVHNDYDALKLNPNLDIRYFQKFNNIVTISQKCVSVFCKNFPKLRDRVVELPNLASSDVIYKMSEEFFPDEYTKIRNCSEKTIVILSIGRLCKQKGFDYAIHAAALMKKYGIKFVWFILGEGEVRTQLERQILDENVSDCVILLGIRENPYPYIKNCDFLVQSSRYEGKSVVLDEGKILKKIIVTTNYATVHDQIINGIDGIIVPISAEGIAEGIVSALQNNSLQSDIENYLYLHEYGNQEQIIKYYKLFD